MLGRVLVAAALVGALGPLGGGSAAEAGSTPPSAAVRVWAGL